MEDPRLAKLLSLIRDHLAIINDLASYDKELRDFESGASADLINIVEVFRRVVSLPDEDAAKGMAYSYQLQIEEWIEDELQRLRTNNELSDEQWRFLYAIIACAAGNAFYSMTSSRYGGEAARIRGDEVILGSYLKERESSEFVADHFPSDRAVHVGA